jgi:CRP-like cAMP-binding protein
MASEITLEPWVRPQNFVLGALSAADAALLAPHLRTVEMTRSEVLYQTNEPIRRVYFPHSGIISVVVELSSGQEIEAAMIGRDTVAGGLFALDGKVSLNKAVVGISGTCSVIDVDRLRAAADQSPSLCETLAVHEQIVFAQSQQSAACNAVHTVEERLARWLLYVRDLLDGDTLELTQEFLGQILGVQRSTVSLVATGLQQRGLITYSRGRMNIANMEKLHAVSCECYAAVRAHRERLLAEG